MKIVKAARWLVGPVILVAPSLGCAAATGSPVDRAATARITTAVQRVLLGGPRSCQWTQSQRIDAGNAPASVWRQVAAGGRYQSFHGVLTEDADSNTVVDIAAVGKSPAISVYRGRSVVEARIGPASPYQVVPKTMQSLVEFPADLVTPLQSITTLTRHGATGHVVFVGTAATSSHDRLRVEIDTTRADVPTRVVATTTSRLSVSGHGVKVFRTTDLACGTDGAVVRAISAPKPTGEVAVQSLLALYGLGAPASR